MELTALDVRYQEFRKSLNGYSVAEVRDYLGRVSDVLASIVEENNALKSRIQTLENELSSSKEGEAELRRAVVAAERIAREIRSQAEQEADLIRREAEATKEASLQELVGEMKRIKSDIEQLRGERELFVTQFRAMLDGYLGSLDRYKRP